MEPNSNRTVQSFDNFLNTTTNAVNIGNIAIGTTTQFQYAAASQEVSTESVENINEVEKQLSNGLKELYKRVVLPQVAFMSRGREKFILSKYYMKLQLGKEEDFIQLEDLFKNFNDKKKTSATFSSRIFRWFALSGPRPKRIFIEGQPGYGKTTLCVKIVYDWAVSAKYLSNFKFAFFVKLRELKGRRVDEEIICIAERCGIHDRNAVFKLLKREGTDTLFILDGFDELSEQDRLSCIQVIYKQHYADVTVLLTCRTGLFEIGWEEMEKIFGVQRETDFHDIKVKIMGVDHNELMRFVETCDPNQKGQEIVDYIDKMDASLKDIFQSPLLLSILVFLVTEGELILEKEIHCKIDFILILVNCIIRRSIVRNGETIAKTFNIFDEKDESSTAYKKIICEFGRLSLEKIMNREIFFSDADLTREIYRLGLLVKDEDENSIQYQPFHLTFLEVTAAFTLWQECLQNDLQFSPKRLKILKTLFLNSKGTAPILSFLGDLLQDNVSCLLKILLPDPDLISSYRFHIRLINAIHFSPAGLISLNSLSPSYATTYVSKHQISKQVIKQAFMTGRIQEIVLNHPFVFFKLPSRVNIHRITFLVTFFQKDISLDVEKLKSITCNTLSLKFSNNIYMAFSMEKCLTIYSMVGAKKRVLNLRDYSDLKTFTTDLHENIAIHALFLAFTVTKEHCEFLCRFLAKHSVKKLKFFCIDNETLSNFFTAGKQLRTLEDIEIINTRFTLLEVSLHQLGKISKSWQNLTLHCVQLIQDPRDSPETDSNIEITRLQLSFSTQETFKTLSVLKIKALKCYEYQLLNFAQNVLDSWTGFQSIQEISVICDSFINRQLFSVLDRFVNLKTLKFSLKAENEIHYDGKSASAYFASHSIDNFTVWYEEFTILHGNSTYQFVHNMISQLQDFIPEDQETPTRSIFNVFNVHVPDLFQNSPNYMNFICKLLGQVEHHHICKLGIVYRDIKWWYLLKSNSITDLSVFDLSDNFFGSRDDDPKEHQDDSNLFDQPWNRLLISARN